MSKTQLNKLAASIRQRLLNISRESGDPFDLVLTRFALERFLYRLGISEHADRFVLKGAMLLAVWGGELHRPTRDVDLLGYGDPSDQQLIDVFAEICRTKVDLDGLVFDAQSIRVAEIREQEEYDGQRVRFFARLANARIYVQVDIGFGDPVTPEVHEIDYPTILEFPAPRIQAYPPESVVSEKLQAMVVLGMVNSRMKDFYDVWMIARQFPFNGVTLVEAIKATFDRRRTALPKGPPIALSDEFSTDSDKIKQWSAFLNRIGLRDAFVGLPKIIDDLRTFLLPPLLAAANEETFNRSWGPRGPWS